MPFLAEKIVNMLNTIVSKGHENDVNLEEAKE
jgi:hypothetical protein